MLEMVKGGAIFITSTSEVSSALRRGPCHFAQSLQAPDVAARAPRVMNGPMAEMPLSHNLVLWKTF